MSTVWKETIHLEDISDVVEFDWPLDSKILHIAEQFPGSIGIWFRCDPTKTTERRRIIIKGTGHDCPTHSPHIASVVLHGGSLVLHFFDGRKVGM